MAKKQSIATSAAAGAAPARAAKPRTTRSAAAMHSKAQTADQVIHPVESTVAPATALIEDPHREIAKLAYEFWEARGYEHGHANEDWLRAEAEYLRRSSN
jgi:hypothetical protein